MKDLTLGRKPRIWTLHLRGSVGPQGRNIKFKNYITWVRALQAWLNSGRQEREKPNTTLRMMPPGVQAASVIRQGGKELLKGPLTASRPLETEEHREVRRVKQPPA
jgi:hypothetical protein